jgi:predicted amidophosphoribosyltransferase
MIEMQSLGMAGEICSECNRPIARGETMTAYEPGGGWFCPECVAAASNHSELREWLAEHYPHILREYDERNN